MNSSYEMHSNACVISLEKEQKIVRIISMTLRICEQLVLYETLLDEWLQKQNNNFKFFVLIARESVHVWKRESYKLNERKDVNQARTVKWFYI